MGEGVGTEEMSHVGREESGGVTLPCVRCQRREKSGWQPGVGGRWEGGRASRPTKEIDYRGTEAAKCSATNVSDNKCVRRREEKKKEKRFDCK